MTPYCLRVAHVYKAADVGWQVDKFIHEGFSTVTVSVREEAI